jgi:hypothetical protein
MAHGVAVLDPGDNADLIANGRDGVSLDRVALFIRGAVEHLIDEGKQLHDSFVQSKILLAFDEVVVLFLVGANNHDLFGSLLGMDDLYLVFEGIYCDVFVVGRVSAK